MHAKIVIILEPNINVILILLQRKLLGDLYGIHLMEDVSVTCVHDQLLPPQPV